MNSDVKQQWVAALRSGEFTQGRTKLKTERTDMAPKHCCLGVLCELHDRQKAIPQSFQSIAGELPDHVMEWAGLEEANPYINRPAYSSYANEYKVHLSFLNDIENLDFGQIADLIEAQL